MSERWQDVEHGWVILDSRKKIWGKQFFGSEEGADGTALRCVSPPYEVVPARRVSYFTRKPSNQHFHVQTDVLVGDGK
ncbi:hypothetical protein [Mesorhizobium sp. RIZ17]|uniref:hypothetical protein n=1 Tax=Mesorhizobium sp. RIZ17 TaxID=3132743 RepID=UPI003DA9803C